MVLYNMARTCDATRPHLPFFLRWVLKIQTQAFTFAGTVLSPKELSPFVTSFPPFSCVCVVGSMVSCVYMLVGICWDAHMGRCTCICTHMGPRLMPGIILNCSSTLLFEAGPPNLTWRLIEITSFPRRVSALAGWNCTRPLHSLDIFKWVSRAWFYSPCLCNISLTTEPSPDPHGTFWPYYLLP